MSYSKRIKKVVTCEKSLFNKRYKADSCGSSTLNLLVIAGRWEAEAILRDDRKDAALGQLRDAQQPALFSSFQSHFAPSGAELQLFEAAVTANHQRGACPLRHTVVLLQHGRHVVLLAPHEDGQQQGQQDVGSGGGLQSLMDSI